MSNLWQAFLFEFCKVSVVCWQQFPNWLGWLVIAVLAIALAVAALCLMIAISAKWNL